MHKQIIHYRTCTGWNTAVGMGCSSASLVLIHSSHRPHVLVAPIHVYIGVSRGPQALDPRVGDDKTYVTTMGMQQTSVQ